MHIFFGDLDPKSGHSVYDSLSRELYCGDTCIEYLSCNLSSVMLLPSMYSKRITQVDSPFSITNCSPNDQWCDIGSNPHRVLPVQWRIFGNRWSYSNSRKRLSSLSINKCFVQTDLIHFGTKGKALTHKCINGKNCSFHCLAIQDSPQRVR